MFNLWRINKKIKIDEEKQIKESLTSHNIEKILGDSPDILKKKLYINNDKNFNVIAFGIDGMVDTNIIDGYIFRPLVLENVVSKVNDEKELYKLIKEGLIYHFEQEERDTLADVIDDILKGLTVLVFDSLNKAVSFDAKNLVGRNVDTPANESALLGSHEAFVENIRMNTGLVRKEIKSPDLRFKEIIVGTRTRTSIQIVYMKDITDNDILSKVISRIEEIKAKDVLSSNIIKNAVRDNKFSIFPQVLYTERVDKFCSNIVDGKIGILIEGLPIGYIVPGLFNMFFQAPEDYAENYLISTTIRCIRYVCGFITLVLPGFYVAVTTFHQEMIPTNLLTSIIKSKEGVPFPTAIEVLGMLLAFEILIEASLRLPKAIGATVSILGGLVIGEAAVNARLISPAVVVVIAISGISDFVMPSQAMSNAFRACRLLLTFCSAISGLFGLFFGCCIIAYYLCKMEVLGVPYLVPFVGNQGKYILRDTFINVPSNERMKNNDE